MARYRLKIERKFSESHVNNSFKMPKLQPSMSNRFSDGNIQIDQKTAKIISNRCNSQLNPTELNVDFRFAGTITTP